MSRAVFWQAQTVGMSQSSKSFNPLVGTWWVEDKPDLQVSGTLSRERGTWQLEIHGVLPGGVLWGRGLSITAPIRIHGRAGHERMTLLGAYLVGGVPSERLLEQGIQHDEMHPDWQMWQAEGFIHGAHVRAESRFKWASFRLTRLESWWRSSGFTPETRDYDSYTPPATLVATWKSAEISLWTRLVTGYGIRSHSAVEQPMITVESAEGFTLDWLQESIVLPFRALLGACLYKSVEAYEFHLELAEPEAEWLAYAELDPTVEPETQSSWAYEMPALSCEQIDFATFFSRWLEMAEAIPLVVASCLRVYRNDPLQTSVVSTVNTAETLQRWLHDTKSESTLVSRVRGILVASDLNKHDRKKVVNSVKIGEAPSLEQRLVTLGTDMGEEFHIWFLDKSLPEWALVAATVRNALSHGYPTDHKVERDIGALIGIEHTVTAMTRLRMLVHAGLPNDFALVNLLIQEQRYLGLLHQDVADWKALAEKISPPDA